MPFEPGKSGNPSGRPGKSEEERKVQLLARQHTVRALNKLAELIDAESEKVAVAACNAILDRGWGKPTQSVVLQDPDGLPIGLQVSYGRYDENRVPAETRSLISTQ